jgi:epoxyqueuosine reductase
MTGGLLVEEVRRIGREAGLDAVGICDAEPFHETRRVLEDRASRGLSAGMQFTYRNPGRATDPNVTLPGAAALVVGARQYERDHDARAATTRHGGGRDHPGDSRVGRHEPAAGRVAMYSWTDHYLPLRAALSKVADHLVQAGWRARVLADDNAMVDRAAAVRAGIGWYGKNTNVLLPGRGSWFVLGSVITDAPLIGILSTSNPLPVPNGCGTCTRCRVACPTGALVGTAELDARRCLAWLLQAPGIFPMEFRAALGDRIYGCDDCQTVCPINRLASRRYPPPGLEPPAQVTVDVLEILAAADGSLMDMVGRWYIPGREPRYVRRNALIVLGNIGRPSDPDVIAALRRALADRDPIIRSHAVWAAARLARYDLLGNLADEQDPFVTAELAAAAGVESRPRMPPAP